MTTGQPGIATKLRRRYGESCNVGERGDLPADLWVEISDGAQLLIIADRVSISRGATIQAHRGATVMIGNDFAIGKHIFISAMVGVGISNMTDLHDRGHRQRSTTNLSEPPLTPRTCLGVNRTVGGRSQPGLPGERRLR